ncbi:hypothetical protein [Hyunsoonleella pacifica]|uniref:DUF2079 domain-containing protein n=1 Tax=Hyunsoonleella pacifica TaxID=1080224 RepID=A0A4Q9FT31_9FLAO|nr:hypothetical protein [Hyunsoonleella pacifica]TBN18529.1 hypothetical protein EYD46_00225 [Hyunsoonleella pacifica]GGD02541.1 hypothetical protein GCM10011368_00460 [Hyunsoonleella pacifica]
MLKLNILKTVLVCVFNCIVAFSFYFENLDATYSELSSDLLNIIPIAHKFDNPELYKEDLYANDIENVKYYIPFFVQPLRFLGIFTNANYLQALNILSLFCHLCFGILWFLMFYRYSSNFWVAFLMSIFVRGVFWLPGLELLGISGLWTMVPRTLYLTLFPIPFLLISSKSGMILLSTFLMGFIFNFHPITGIGGILLYILYLTFFSKKGKVTFKNITWVIGILVMGMLPFILTYFQKTPSLVNYSIEDYLEAFYFRIPKWFINPVLFVKSWSNRGAILMFLPIIIYLLVGIKYKSHTKRSRRLAVITLLMFVLPLLSVYVEQLINSLFSLNLRMSFQLIRAQKMALVPSYFAMTTLLVMLSKKIKFIYFTPVITVCFIMVLVLSKSAIFKGVTIVNNDTFNSILPFNLSLSKPSQKRNKTKDAMAKYIEDYTHVDAVIFGDYLYRSASKRSVILDTKGASMLIEGNPERYIDWYQSKMKFRSIGSIDEKIEYLRYLGVDYYVTQNTTYNLEVVHNEGSWLLYKI